MIVIPALMISCQVSEKAKNGPAATPIKTTASASAKMNGRPAAVATRLAIAANQRFIGQLQLTF